MAGRAGRSAPPPAPDWLEFDPPLKSDLDIRIFESLLANLGLYLSKWGDYAPQYDIQVTIRWRHRPEYCDYCIEDLPEDQLQLTAWHRWHADGPIFIEYWCADCRRKLAAILAQIEARPRAKKLLAQARRRWK